MTMEAWDWAHETDSNQAGAVIRHEVKLRTEQAWVDVRAANGTTVTRVFGDGTAVVLTY